MTYLETIPVNVDLPAPSNAERARHIGDAVAGAVSELLESGGDIRTLGLEVDSVEITNLGRTVSITHTNILVSMELPE